MEMNDKKGVSTIVTVVLLILVAITAVALIAAFVIPFIRNSLNQSEECFAVLGKVDVVPGQYTCYSATSNNVSVRINRGFANDVDVQAIAVVLSGGGQSKRFDVSSAGSANVAELGGSFGAALSLPSEGEERTYVFNAAGFGAAVTSAQVSPILSNSKVCDAVTAEIPACSA